MKNFVGIVIGSTKYKENSSIVRIYTQDGIKSVLVGKIDRYMSFFNYLNVLNIDVYKSKNKIYKLKDVCFYYKYLDSVQYQPFKLFLSEILYQVFNKETYDKDLFDYILNQFDPIDKKHENVDIKKFVSNFLIELTKPLGFYPQKRRDNELFFDLKEGTFCNNLPSHKYYVPKKYILLWDNLIRKKNEDINDENFKIITKIIITYYQIHLHNFNFPSSYKLIIGIL